MLPSKAVEAVWLGMKTGYSHLRKMVAKGAYQTVRSEEAAVLRVPSHSNPYHSTSQEMRPSLGVENLRPT